MPPKPLGLFKIVQGPLQRTTLAAKPKVRGVKDKLGRINEEFRINRYMLLCIKQINNKDLLYGTGDYIQYLVVAWDGKESEKEH